MKKVLLTTIAVALVFATDLSARCCRKQAACQTYAAPACAAPVVSVPTYQVVEDTCTTAVPKCIKYVPVEGTPICYRTCRFACPAGFEMAGNKDAHSFELDASGAERVGY